MYNWLSSVFCLLVNQKIPVEITVLKDTVSHNYLGNGVEWDPYDEAESWGHSVSEDDWNKLFKRLDFMKPQYVRCMINSPYRYLFQKMVVLIKLVI